MGESLLKILLVMAGGSLGAVARYGVSLAAVRLLGTGFPWGTFLVNMAGCFAIGVLVAAADRLAVRAPERLQRLDPALERDALRRLQPAQWLDRARAWRRVAKTWLSSATRVGSACA